MSAEPSPRVYLVTVPGLCPTPNDVLRMPLRLRLRVKRQWRDMTLLALIASRVQCLHRARVTFTRYSSREPDSDALSGGAMKWVRDALVQARVIDDDGPGYLEATYRHGRSARDEARVELTIEEWP